MHDENNTKRERERSDWSITDCEEGTSNTWIYAIVLYSKVNKDSCCLSRCYPGLVKQRSRKKNSLSYTQPPANRVTLSFVRICVCLSVCLSVSLSVGGFASLYYIMGLDIFWNGRPTCIDTQFNWSELVPIGTCWCITDLKLFSYPVTWLQCVEKQIACIVGIWHHLLVPIVRIAVSLVSICL